MSTRPPRTLIGLSALTAVAAAGAAGLVGAAPAAGAAHHPAHHAGFGYRANPYGSLISLGSVAQSGSTAPAPLPCTATPGTKRSNHAGASSLPQIGNTGEVTTHSASRRLSKSAVESASSTRINGLNLFGGELIAKTITTTATVRHSSKGYTAPATVTISGLKINGQSKTQKATRDQTYSLPGVGKLVLDHQRRNTEGGTGRALGVDGMRITSAKNNSMGLPARLVITIAHADASLIPQATGLVHGSAVGSEAVVNGKVTSGPAAERMLSCLGTNGATLTRRVDGSTVPSAVQNGTITSSVAGQIKGKHRFAMTRERIQGIDLLAGVVSAKTVTAKALVRRTAHGFSRSAKGSSFGDLVVAGKPAIGDKVPSNTKINLPGLGTLYLHRIVKTANGVQVRMIDLHLTHASSGMPAGADLIVGLAKASMNR